MTAADLLAQLVTGLAQASTLFLLASGLSLIFGVTRIVNFAHGSLYMVGTYAGITLAERFGGGAFGFWGAVLGAGIGVAVIGAIIEIAILRRIYRAPELFQLLATFGVVLVLKDAALWMWGPEDILGPRAPGLKGAIDIAGSPIPQYDLLLVVVGPAVLGLLHVLLTRTRWGMLIRAATEDRDMVGALGVHPGWLFTGVFVLGSGLAGLAGALQMPREPASLALDLTAITDAFVVVVIGGLGSLGGAFIAALIIGLTKALCFALGTVDVLGTSFNLSKFTLVVEFVLMAITLAVRPHGLAGRGATAAAEAGTVRDFVRPPGARFFIGTLVALGLLALLPWAGDDYAVVLATDCAIFALFAVSLHLLMGPGGMASFGHAAFFGIGAYGAALLAKQAGWPMLGALAMAPVAAAAFAAVVGWFSVRLSGVYLAMLTLAFAQIAWSIAYQWDDVTGGSNGLVGVWPAAAFSDKTRYFLLTLTLCGAGIVALWLIQRSAFGYALRAGRDAPRRADALGIAVSRVQWFAFPLAGAAAGLAGALYVFSKGSLAPDVMAISRSVDGLVMVLLGGLQTLTGPVVGAALFTWLQDEIIRRTDYWRLILGVAILAIVLAVPSGVVGGIARAAGREKA